MPRSSLTSSPPKPSSPRSRSVAMAARDRVAGWAPSRWRETARGRSSTPRPRPARLRRRGPARPCAGAAAGARPQAGCGANRGRCPRARESACRSPHPGRPQPPPERQGVGDHRRRGGAEGPVADHRVGRVGVDVQHGGERPANPQQRQFLPQRTPHGKAAPGSPAAATDSMSGHSVSGARSRCTARPPGRPPPAAAARRGAARRARPGPRWPRVGGAARPDDVGPKQDHTADLGASDPPQQLRRGHRALEPHAQQLPAAAPDLLGDHQAMISRPTSKTYVRPTAQSPGKRGVSEGESEMIGLL